MKAKVLIVDDSSVSRMMIKGRIAGLQPDWDILEAADGTQALAVVQSDSPDFITMDVNMPGMNGFETVEKIRQVNQRAKIVILTANIQESSRVRAESMGLSFVQKPITDASIKQVVDHFMETP